MPDISPKGPFGTHVGLLRFVEIVLWVIFGLVWLAFEGGVLGLAFGLVIAVSVGIAWRDIARRIRNSTQQRGARQ